MGSEAVMADEKEVERVAVVISASIRAEGGGYLVDSTMARAIARAVLSAIPSYAQGWDDAKRRAVEEVETFSDNPLTDNGPYFLAVDVLAAIRAIEPEKGTHEERWAAAGWPFKWDDDLREYHARTGEATDGAVLWGGPDFGWHVILPTVQAVDAWINSHPVKDGKIQ
jgi:hypothetical protein